MEFSRTRAAAATLAAFFTLLGTAPYGSTTVPHSTAALRTALAASCSGSYEPPRPTNRRFEMTFNDVVGASATVKVYVDPDGRVAAADIVSASDDITGATAINVLASQRFVPARCGAATAPGVFLARFN